MDDVTSDVTEDVTSSSTDDVKKARNISELILSCCLLNPAGNWMHQMAFRKFLYLKNRCLNFVHWSGSSAEFYIVPAVVCIGDFDLMMSRRDSIAVWEESTFDNIDVNETAEVLKIETSNCPNGYVHLRLIGRLQFNWNTEKYEYFVTNGVTTYLSNWTDKPFDNKGFVIQGPAATYDAPEPSFFSKIDFVYSMQILGWPPAAQSWISRDRNYAWPSNAIVSEVQRNGCDLVRVSHRDYKHDKLQFRYSFSRAEITLIRSWTPIQQIIYHLIRYVVKLTIIREWKDDDKVVCTYHIKTLMLWACERKPPVWWKSNCLIALCSKLLDTLTKWVGKKHCPHYFIPEWNLFDPTMKESRRVDTIETLRNVAKAHNLPDWFRINYVSKVFVDDKRAFISNEYYKAQQELNVFAASNRFDKQFCNILQKYALARSTRNSKQIENDAMDHYGESEHDVIRLRTLITSRNLASGHQCLNMAVVSLRLAWNISRKKEFKVSNQDLLEVLSEVVLKLSDYDTWNRNTLFNIVVPFRQCSKWYFIKGVRLLSKYCKKHSAAYCIWVKTCKRYFKSALSIQDEYSESIYDACHVYLSALYYVSGTNQDKAIIHCMEAKNKTSFSSNTTKPYFMDYTSLLFVDTIAHVSGFYILFDHAVLHNQDALSAKGFSLSAVVFSMIFLLETNCKNSSTKLILTSPFDIYLCAISTHEYRRKRQTENRKTSKYFSSIPNNLVNNEEEIQVTLSDTLEETLVKICVEMFTKYHEISCIRMTRAGFPYDCQIVSHFEALYYYRTGEYKELLRACNSIISREFFLFLTNEKNPEIPSLWNIFYVPVLFSFQMFFGNDVIFLTGLVALVDRKVFKWKHVHEDHESVVMQMRNQENRSSSSSNYYLTFIRGKLRGYQSLSNWPKVSPLFLVYYLRYQSLIQLNYPKSDILSALNDLKHASRGFVFEDMLLLFVGMILKRKH